MVAEDQGDKAISVQESSLSCLNEFTFKTARAMHTAFIDLNENVDDELPLKRINNEKVCTFHRTIAAVSHKHSQGILSCRKQFTPKNHRSYIVSQQGKLNNCRITFQYLLTFHKKPRAVCQPPV